MNKTYCCTDFHGKLSLWHQIKEYCDDSDTIFFLGDAIDRGNDGLQIMKELILDERVVYLKGNHEELLERIGDSLRKNKFSLDINNWLINGGDPTIKDFKKLSEFSQAWYIQQTKKMLDFYIYTNKKNQNIILSHAGRNPWDKDFEKSIVNRDGENSWHWDRTHFLEEWNPDPKYNNIYVVHGHTNPVYIMKTLNKMTPKNKIKPYPNLEEWNCTILKYANGHKFCLDLASYLTRCVALFDLDELKVEKYFWDKKEEGVK